MSEFKIKKYASQEIVIFRSGRPISRGFHEEYLLNWDGDNLTINLLEETKVKHTNFSNFLNGNGDAFSTKQDLENYLNQIMVNSISSKVEILSQEVGETDFNFKQEINTFLSF